MASLVERAKTVVAAVRSKNLETWVGGYARWLAASAVRRARAEWAAPRTTRHLLFAFCDHYEPLWKTTDEGVARGRVQQWLERYPVLADEFRDSDGRPPRHSFFFPGEEYRPAFLDGLAQFARRGIGEVEVHLHHDSDTAAGLREKLESYLALYAEHGHLSRDSLGRRRYAFIHGNWCLANGHRDGTWCGVDEELPLLHDTGCYADFTFPAAPDDAQPAIVNRIYWPEGDLSRRRAYEHGSWARVGDPRHDRILMIEGPLALGRARSGFMPGIENAEVTALNPATPERIRSWVRQQIGVLGRPEWVFVKVHTHGAQEAQAAEILGDGGRQLHRELTTRYNDGQRWRLHYVTAREMYNVAIAAMDGRTGNPDSYRDYVLPPPPVAAA
jgi:hypothetical protein